MSDEMSDAARTASSNTWITVKSNCGEKHQSVNHHGNSTAYAATNLPPQPIIQNLLNADIYL